MDRTVLTDVCTINGDRDSDRGSQHGLEGEVVDDVDGRDAVPTFERVGQ